MGQPPPSSFSEDAGSQEDEGGASSLRARLVDVERARRLAAACEAWAWEACLRLGKNNREPRIEPKESEPKPKEPEPKISVPYSVPDIEEPK